MDRLSKAKRSWLMSRVRAKDTKPEMKVRRTLHRIGFRYRVHVDDLPGKPDLVFPSRRKVLLIHGCYWHGHSCRYGSAQSKSNVEYWQRKIAANQKRDKLVVSKLRALGWKVLVVWECKIKRDNWHSRVLTFLETT
jgi:DNA mismatch endonuclease, patch repair protein